LDHHSWQGGEVQRVVAAPASEYFTKRISNVEEEYDCARDRVPRLLFDRLGLADASIATVRKRNVLI
jgi:hypothetical protein